MITGIGYVSVKVSDQDKAKEFYTEKLGLALYDDVLSPDGWRWITVGPKDNRSVVLSLLQDPSTDEKAPVEGDSCALPVCVLTTKDCSKTAKELQDRGVKFIKEPTDEFWGVDALFTDLDGNVFDLCQPKDH